MENNKNKLPKRKIIRLQDYDYSYEGLYFITICTHNKEKLFGKVENDNVILNEYGKIVEKHWLKIEEYNKNIKLLEYIIMPNHIHGILWFLEYIGDIEEGFIKKDYNIKEELETKERKEYIISRRKMALPKIIGKFKMQSAKEINMKRAGERKSVWQRGYYEHIIRNEKSYIKIADYILKNPLKWEKDEYYK